MVVAQVADRKAGMLNLDRPGGLDESPVRQVDTCGVRECDEPCPVQQLRDYRHSKWLVAYGFKGAK